MANALDTGVLHRDDNLSVLSNLPSESVDLIYLDPPFFSNKFYEVIWGEEAEIRSFEDRWEGGIQHYIGWMRDRVSEMRRVLKPTGSFYLHCDPHASHYLKVMLDGVFGQRKFRNEVIWKRTSAHNRLRRYGPVHDVVFFYTASDAWTWNPQHMPYDPDYVEMNFAKVEASTGRRFSTADLTSNNPGSSHLWKGKPPPGERFWGVSEETMKTLEAEGRIYYTRTGLPRLINYLDDMPGQLLQDVWTDLNPVHAHALERRGYPTQKPEALLERILLASSKPDDVVLDPFCGCGTTVAVADRLGRQFVGIDISVTAVEIVRRRLLKQGRTIDIENAVETIRQLKDLKPFEFQNWIINAIFGTHSAKKVKDMGIDGYTFFTRDPVQVKQQEKVGRETLDKFETAIRRVDSTTGYVIGFSFTRDAVEEAARAKKEGLDIRLVKVAEVLIGVKRPHGKQTLPLPTTVEELPLPPARKQKDMPSVEELIESDIA